MNPILIKLAKISPKSYADKILKRNKELLRKLMLLKPYVGKDKEIPEDIAFDVICDSFYGCPHCNHHGCSSDCLWRKVTSSNQPICFDIPFSYGKRKGKNS